MTKEHIAACVKHLDNDKLLDLFYDTKAKIMNNFDFTWIDYHEAVKEEILSRMKEKENR